jgi:formyltetrahydrofolate deformylase
MVVCLPPSMGDATAILRVICPDRSGLVSELSGWVAANGGNIRHADHHTDAGAGLFLSRVEALIRKGRDSERLALARAVRLHLRQQVMVYCGRTAVSD